MRGLHNKQISLISLSQAQTVAASVNSGTSLFQDSSRLSVVGIGFLRQLAMMMELLKVTSLMHLPDRVLRADPGERFPMSS